MGKFQDLTGLTFGRLTVLERGDNRINKSGGHSIMWKCKCSCGNPNIILVESSHLNSGKTKSCGCLRKEGHKFNDLTGMKFNMLTVIKRIENSKHNKARWYCKCDCGNYTNVVGSSLKSGKVKSCGCLKRKYNDYEIQEDYVIMYTSKNEMFLVDLEDFNKVKEICWHKNSNGYLVGEYMGKSVLLSRFIMDCPNGMVVDHRHGTESIYDNRKSNLRIGTYSQNSKNKEVHNNNSDCIGVWRGKNSCKWQAYIKNERKFYYLGSYDKKEDAVAARKEAEKKYFGEWSYDNSRQGTGVVDDN